MLWHDGLTVAMMHVLALPPSDSCRMRVSFDSRYGTCAWWSVSDVMTRPSVSSDWLIMPASFFLSSFAPLRPMFSLPARSTRLSVPRLMRSSPSAEVSRIMMLMVKMECERELCLFIRVSAVVRRF